MATIQELTALGFYETKNRDYAIELPAGTTPAQANEMIYDGLTENNTWTNAGVEIVSNAEGKQFIFIPANQVQNIDAEELGLFSKKLTEARIGEAKAIKNELYEDFDGIKASMKKLTPEQMNKLDIDRDGKITKADLVPMGEDATFLRFLKESEKIEKDGSIKSKEPVEQPATKKDEPAAEKEQTENVKRVIELQEKLKKTELTELEKTELQGIKLTDDEKKQLQDHHNSKPKDEKTKSEASLNGYVEKHKDDKDLKTKAQIVEDMFKSGDVMGAILAMIFMPENDPEKSKPVSQMLIETKQAAGIPLSSPEAAKETEPKLSDKAKDDIEMIKYRDDAEQKLVTARKELETAQSELKTAKEKFDAIKDPKPADVKALADAEDKEQGAQGNVKKLEDNAAKYKTSGEKEMEAKLKDADTKLKDAEAKIKELEAKAADLDKAADEKVKTAQKEFDALIKERGGADADTKAKIDAKLTTLLANVPDSDFKDGLIATRDEQNKQLEQLKGLLAQRYVEGGPSSGKEDFEKSIKNLDLVEGQKAMDIQDKHIAESKAKEAAAKAKTKPVVEELPAPQPTVDATKLKAAGELLKSTDIGTQTATATGQEFKTLDNLAKPNKDGKVTDMEMVYDNLGTCNPAIANKARFEKLAAALDLDGNNKITLDEVSNTLNASGLKSKDANEFAQNFNRAAKTVGSDKQIQM